MPNCKRLQVLQYSGPLSESPGQLLRIVVETGPRSLLTKPWDVLVKNGNLYVASHKLPENRPNGPVNMYNVASGELLHSWIPTADHALLGGLTVAVEPPGLHAHVLQGAAHAPHSIQGQ